MWVRSLGWEDPLEECMSTQYSIVAWGIPWTEELGGHSPWGGRESDMTEVTTGARTSPGKKYRQGFTEAPAATGAVRTSNRFSCLLPGQGKESGGWARTGKLLPYMG